jgi:hypothetical protein
MKILILLVGLILGFGGGVYWGVKHPTHAADLARKEEEWFLKGKAEATRIITQKLDQALAQTPAKTDATPRTGFVADSGSANNTAPAADALRKIRDEQKQQLMAIEHQLEQVKK